jgi:hypothetical protein
VKISLHDVLDGHHVQEILLVYGRTHLIVTYLRGEEKTTVRSVRTRSDKGSYVSSMSNQVRLYLFRAT